MPAGISSQAQVIYPEIDALIKDIASGEQYLAFDADSQGDKLTKAAEIITKEITGLLSLLKQGAETTYLPEGEKTNFLDKLEQQLIAISLNERPDENAILTALKLVHEVLAKNFQHFIKENNTAKLASKSMQNSGRIFSNGSVGALLLKKNGSH